MPALAPLLLLSVVDTGLSEGVLSEASVQRVFLGAAWILMAVARGIERAVAGSFVY